MKIMWIGLLVACFELTGADQILEGGQGAVLSPGDVWFDGKHFRKGDDISGVERSQSFMAAMLEQQEEKKAQEEDASNQDRLKEVQADLERQKRDLSYLSQIQKSFYALWGLLICKSSQSPQPADNRTAVYCQPSAQPPVQRCFSCKEDPLCILNCCCCCLGCVGCFTAPCRSGE